MLLTGLVSILYFKQKIRKSKEKEERSKLELKAIQAQFNPHFVFNALNSIQYLVNKDDRSSANNYLNELSTLMRNSLYSHDQELLPLSTELQILESYVKLEELRFHFQYSIDVDDSINSSAVSIPTLLMQPIVENAIKHGVGPLAENGSLHISIKRKDDMMLVYMEDNGRGFDVDKEYTGFGLRLVAQRIAMLNKQYRIAMETKSSENGTIVLLLFDNWL